MAQNAGQMAAQAVGIKVGDLPDLTIKEVKVYATNIQGQKVLNGETGRIATIVTNSGIEGNYTLLNSIWHTGWNMRGWLDYAKTALPGKNVYNVVGFTNQWENRKGTFNPYAGVIDCCCWDILGKAVNLPIYKMFGGCRDKVMAYASSAHLANIEAYEADVIQAKKEGYKAYKVHPGNGQHASGPAIPVEDGHIEILKLVRKTAGPDMFLLHDPVQRYNRTQALKVGKVLDELGYVAFEDPLPTTDIDGLVELCKAVETPVHVGEFMPNMYAFAEYIKRGAMDVVRLIMDSCGGISGMMKVANLAECHGMQVHPHNWGEAMEVASHFHVELASPNAPWFEMPHPATGQDRSYHKDKIRINKDGYIPAPTAPGLGYPLDRDVMDKIMIRIER
jgi:L-alanine-DL-glutamate epimerase-like enolase superfamily enzyme